MRAGVRVSRRRNLGCFRRGVRADFLDGGRLQSAAAPVGIHRIHRRGSPPSTSRLYRSIFRDFWGELGYRPIADCRTAYCASRSSPIQSASVTVSTPFPPANCARRAASTNRAEARTRNAAGCARLPRVLPMISTESPAGAVSWRPGMVQRTILGITEAARQAGVSRSTIHRYLKKGTFSATRQSDGSRGVDVAELARVFPGVAGDTSQERSRDSAMRQSATPSTRSSETVSVLVATMKSEVEHLRERVSLLERELADAKNDKNRLLGIVEQRQLSGPGVSLWRRLFGGEK